MIKIPENFQSFEYVRPILWEEIFEIWRQGEEYQESWRKHREERGFSSWTEWRKNYSDPIEPEKKDWHLFKLIDPKEDILDIFGVPSRGWIKKCYEGEATKKLSEIIDHPLILNNDKIESIMRDFPKNTMLTGIINDGRIILGEGMHRACALAKLAKDGRSLESEIFFALAEYEGDLPKLGKGEPK